MKFKRKTIGTYLGATFLGIMMVVGVITGLRAWTAPAAHAAGGLNFSKLTDHPYASQSGYLQGDGSVTPAGRQIRNIVITNGGKLIAGYGDGNGNSDSWGIAAGRVGVVPYDIATDSWGTITYAGSEAIDTMRLINGALYIPTIDPSIYGSGGYLTNKSGTWQRVSNVPDAVHIFDITTSNGNDILLFGSQEPGGYNTATVWRSTDDGASWSVAMTDTSIPEPGGMERYYWGMNLGGDVYTQASSTYPQPPTRTLSGLTGLWAEASDTSFDPGKTAIEVFDGKIIRAKYDGTISTFDGTTAGAVTFANANEGAVRDFYIDGGYLYVLNDSAVYRTKSLSGTWQRLGEVPSNMLSVAVYDDTIYLGDAVGSIWRSDTSIAAAVAPISTCFAFAGGVVTGYYDNENNDPANPTCPSQVVLPASIGGVAVIAIADNAFSGKTFASFTMPNSVTSIGREAFAGVGLSSLTLSAGLVTIGERAFVGNHLTSLTIPDAVTEISQEAFMGNSLINLELRSGVTFIKARAFAENNLTNLTIPDSVTNIGTEAFRKNKLTSLQLGSEVQLIGPGAFSYNQLTSVTIPTSVNVLGYDIDMYDSGARQEGSFEGNHIRSLTFDSSSIWITGPAFALNELTSVTIPTAVTSISSEVFMLQNPKGGDALADAGLSTLVDIFQTPNNATMQILSTVWYVQAYTQDPLNQNNLQDGVYAYSWANNGTNYGGYLVNPASITANYVDTAGTSIRPSDTFVGDGLSTYLVKDNPYDSLSATAKKAALGRYYRFGSTSIIKAPTISGYVLSAPITFSVALSGRSATTKFIYTTEYLAGVTNKTALSATGENMLQTACLAVGMICLGTVVVMRYRREALIRM